MSNFVIYTDDFVHMQQISLSMCAISSMFGEGGYYVLKRVPLFISFC